jgi:hypothetical protein
VIRCEANSIIGARAPGGFMTESAEDSRVHYQSAAARRGALQHAVRDRGAKRLAAHTAEVGPVCPSTVLGIAHTCPSTPMSRFADGSVIRAYRPGLPKTEDTGVVCQESGWMPLEEALWFAWACEALSTLALGQLGGSLHSAESRVAIRKMTASS